MGSSLDGSSAGATSVREDELLSRLPAWCLLLALMVAWSSSDSDSLKYNAGGGGGGETVMTAWPGGISLLLPSGSCASVVLVVVERGLVPLVSGEAAVDARRCGIERDRWSWNWLTTTELCAAKPAMQSTSVIPTNHPAVVLGSNLIRGANLFIILSGLSSSPSTFCRVSNVTARIEPVALPPRASKVDLWFLEQLVSTLARDIDLGCPGYGALHDSERALLSSSCGVNRQLWGGWKDTGHRSHSIWTGPSS